MRMAFALWVLVMVATSCKTAKPATTPLVVQPTQKVANLPIADREDFTILTSTIKDSILTLEVELIKPCGTSTFDFFADGKMSKSLPPQISCLLVHKLNNPPTCKNTKKIKQKIHFNINNLRINGQSKVVLVINNSTRVEFNYFPFLQAD